MRKIDIDYVDIGSKLAKSIYGMDGLMLLSKGAELTSAYIERLRKTGVSSVYIDDGFIDDIEEEEIISLESRKLAVQALKKVFTGLKGGSLEDFLPIKTNLSLILDEITTGEPKLLRPSDISLHNDYTYNHSVNVAVVSVVIGMALNYDKKKLFDLGIAAMLHDIGTVKLPSELLNKPSKLSDAEYATVKRHPHFGYEILISSSKVDTMTSLSALQHHERFDGSGYPKGLQNKSISEFARILAVADVYDAMSSDRYFRKSIPSDEIYKFFKESSGRLFHPEIIEVFLDKIAVYPVGTMVVLSDGHTGFVIKQNYRDPRRPVIRVFWDRAGTELALVQEVDLLEKTELEVFQVIGGKTWGIKHSANQ